MFRILAFISIIQSFKMFLEFIFQDKSNAFKIAGNITSIINGVVLIMAPLCGRFDVIIDFNIAYNLVDIINASTVYRLHHIGVFIIDYLILSLKTYDEQYYSMLCYSLIELSNIFVWYFYHKIKFYSYTMSTVDMQIQLYWYVGVRSIAYIIMCYVCYYYRLYIELIPFVLIMIGSVYWSRGMYKKMHKSQI